MTSGASRLKNRPVAAIMFKLPLMIDCITFEGFILDYFDGTLTFRQKFVFDLHLLMCRECRVYLKEYKAAMDLAASQKNVDFSDMDMGEVPEDLVKAIVAATKKSE